MTKWIIIELYSNMPTNEIEDCKMAGDIIKKPHDDAIKLIGILQDQHIEYTVWTLGECLIDHSYEYWKD